MNWTEEATHLDWIQQPTKESETFGKAFFEDGTVNACYNCVDRHLPEKKEAVALLWENEEGEKEVYTYQRLFDEVVAFANGLKTIVKKGDVVTLYLPLIPQAVIAMLACARIGAIHNVVFSAFSADSLKKRVQDGQSKVIITSDFAYHKGKALNQLAPVREILSDCDSVEKVVVFTRKDTALQGKEVQWQTIAEGTCEPEEMHATDTLFTLYTSGSTGKPKGIMHTTGGYLTYANYTTRTVFGLKDEDIYWCTADVGWITGHSYVVYGPLSCGKTIFMYEGNILHPSPHKIWELIEQYKITILYTAPTAIRQFMKLGDAFPLAHDLSSLRLLGTVGEPINPEAWQWYARVIGKEHCPVVDTWWQTETGGIMITTLPGEKAIPGVAGKALPGVDADIVDEDGVSVTQGEEGILVVKKPWPGLFKGITDKEREKEYFFNGWYRPGDGAKRDEKGNVQITGRLDDCMNTAGHLLSTAEIESALVAHEAVAEAAVVGNEDEVKGEVPVAFVVLKEGRTVEEQVLKEQVRKTMSPLAMPAEVHIVADLPKTRSGKIMRRLLRKKLRGEDLGDVSTLVNPECLR